MADPRRGNVISNCEITMFEVETTKGSEMIKKHYLDSIYAFLAMRHFYGVFPRGGQGFPQGISLVFPLGKGL